MEDEALDTAEVAELVAAVAVGTLLAWGLTKLAVGVGAGVAWGLAKLVSSSSNDGRLDHWRFPACGKLKMNTDGSVTGSLKVFGGRAGFGGVIRDESGSWKMGFYGRLADCSSSVAEVQGIYRGLQIIKEHGFCDVEIETDLQSAVKQIKDGHRVKERTRKIVEECRVILGRTRCKLKHIGNKANKVADEMAILGRDQDKDFVTFSSPPPNQKIKDFLEADVTSAKSD
ncbi:hypothetical protein Vadar_014796 [Vaccinium darrowii]|uniref:Uncharacterized protein n=1 Tax=Vaccinium darrowii TaxID=229202 RepID=A0ACB7XHK9_9ERIC|nr:hypothetical protein Vadar_014796 [Vaccinium darrowii]